jgi:hypothetical protein
MCKTVRSKINSLSHIVKQFFICLLLLIDEQGKLSEDWNLLCSALVSMSPQVRLTVVSAGPFECKATRFRSVFERLDKKNYLHVNRFCQTLRWLKRQYPPAPPK